ncbi:helix-turn-helix domain-containing protein [Streptomyces sp. Amel2xC10]|uniref:helix-turn-helix domain-containing protein n=1 Tax=Streptomyces sp. Amel2xC10 TaxID=1305826 RepID=UPI000A08D618|nr:helix-turn-helix domain-containing protein [Streptomyces sp. Amel2xC10]SME92442.1 PucR C-terminal helix-turn-helix domain-containing protein [Streptomyces sp. Amel2xC10]
MQYALRSRTVARPAPAPSAVPAHRPRPQRVRSLIDADALQVLHRAARVLLADLPDLTDRLVAALQEEEPAYRAAVASDPSATWQEVHRSLRHSVSSLLDPRGHRDAARRCSWKIGASRAEQGLPLDALLHAFRLGGSLVWQGLVEETSRTAPEDVRLLVHVAADVWNFVDEHCTLVADAYRQVERQLAWRRENRLRLLAAALLDGTSRIADLPETAHALDLPEQGRYAVVAVTGGCPADTAAVRAAYGRGTRVYWHTGVEVDYGIVLLGDDDPDPGRDAGADDGPAPAHGGTRTGVGTAVTGLAAVGDARRLADLALGLCPQGGGTVRLTEHLPAALVVSAPELGSALADRVLGPLGALEPADEAVLLDTLATWLACDGSAQRAGERLYCHRNTVLNRLRRYEQLTGRSLSRPTDVVEISLALTSRGLRGTP